MANLVDFVYVGMYLHVFTCVSVQLSTCMCLEVRGQCRESSSISLYIIFETGSLPEPGSYKFI